MPGAKDHDAAPTDGSTADGSATDGFMIDVTARQLLEIGVGAAILGLRQLNIARRDLVDNVPALGPAVDAMLDQIDELSGPLSHAVGTAVATIGDALPDAQAELIRDFAADIAELGPELIRLSGLTRRE